MNNNRTDVAIKYISDYLSKNPNSNWVKVMHHSEDDTGEVLLAKIEEMIGGKRDFFQLCFRDDPFHQTNVQFIF